MENLATALNQLRAQRRQSQQQLETLDQAITALDRLARNGSAGRRNHPKHSLCSRPQTNLSSSEGSVGKSKSEAGKGCGLSAAIRYGSHVDEWRVSASRY